MKTVDDLPRHLVQMDLIREGNKLLRVVASVARNDRWFEVVDLSSGLSHVTIEAQDALDYFNADLKVN